MVDERTADLVRQAYEGEVLGSELFAALAGREPEPDRKRRLVAAQLLEEQTMAAAVALAEHLGVPLAESVKAREAGQQAATALETLDWPDRMQAVAGATGGYRDLYSRLAEVVPDPSHPSVEALLSHERALHAFAAAEAAGDADSLSLLVAALDDDHQERLAALG